MKPTLQFPVKNGDDLSLFEPFARGKQNQQYRGSNCVIYTRVSTKEQADNNLSLETQRKACEQYARKTNYSIMGYFGGTYESAKTDERRHFNAMLNFVKRSRERISHIIVYSVDRFSRSGANAIYIAEQLKKEGIIVFAVTQPTDTTTASGSLQQNIQFIFSEYDNQLRREKCMAGVREKLLNGIWVSAPPIGYSIVKENGKKSIVLNETGKLLKKAFVWKAEGVSIEGLRIRLSEKGLDIDSRRIADFLKNPFYCGLLVHKALEGKVVEGVQEKAVSRELFLQVNGLLTASHPGYSIKPENKDISLKRFIKCEDCGGYLRAYKAWKNQQYYYKCNTKGCRCNKRADSIHEKFFELMLPYQLNINEDTQHLIALQMIATYNQLTKEKQEDTERLVKQFAEAEKKIQRLEERYINEEIDRELFLRYKEKFIAERLEIETKLLQSNDRVSNLEQLVEKALGYAAKLKSLWDLGGYQEKQRIQFLVFPEGMTYNRKKDECRTPRVNSALLYIAQLIKVLDKKKSGNTSAKNNVPALVENTGVEPVTLCMPCKCSGQLS